jgi:hypothetical protein
MPRRGDAKKIFHHEEREEHGGNLDAINRIYRIMFYHRGTEVMENRSAGGLTPFCWIRPCPFSKYNTISATGIGLLQRD